MDIRPTSYAIEIPPQNIGIAVIRLVIVVMTIPVIVAIVRVIITVIVSILVAT